MRRAWNPILGVNSLQVTQELLQSHPSASRAALSWKLDLCGPNG